MRSGVVVNCGSWWCALFFVFVSVGHMQDFASLPSKAVQDIMRHPSLDCTEGHLLRALLSWCDLDPLPIIGSVALFHGSLSLSLCLKDFLLFVFRAGVGALTIHVADNVTKGFHQGIDEGNVFWICGRRLS